MQGESKYKRLRIFLEISRHTNHCGLRLSNVGNGEKQINWVSSVLKTSASKDNIKEVK